MRNIFSAARRRRKCAPTTTWNSSAALPLDIKIREQADSGKPTVVAEPDGKISKIYLQMARRVAVKIADMAQDHSAAFPKIVVKST